MSSKNGLRQKCVKCGLDLYEIGNLCGKCRARSDIEAQAEQSTIRVALENMYNSGYITKRQYLSKLKALGKDLRLL